MACGKARKGEMRCRKAGANNLLKVTDNSHNCTALTLEKCGECTDILQKYMYSNMSLPGEVW